MINKRLSPLIRTLFVLASFLITQVGFAQNIDELVAHAREMAIEAYEQLSYPGMSVAVSIGGDLIWAEGFGFSDVENQIPITTESLFRIGSISKPFTAAAVAHLFEQDALDPDAPVQQYVPEFPKKRWTVTTRQLGGHLAGIRHYRGNEMMSDVHYPTVESGLAIFSSDSLIHEPGSKYQYSSYGWNLISAVVEGASGVPFLDYMTATVFEPLGMTHTLADMAAEDMEGRVEFYVRDVMGNIVVGPYVDNSYKWAGGGFLSTPSDIVLFANAHLDDSYLNATARAFLFTPQKTLDGAPTQYGFGWSVSEDDQGRLLLGHTGGSVGGTSIMQMNAAHDVVVALTINQSSADLTIGRNLMHFFLDELEGETR